ncbi:response regulator [Paenibacillus hemerocallicola]|uniref:Response regulator n=1 Tax=Paenibacillus hemerocallicola TaxID=1172614 RepID=A0A5C4SVZ3_9BACL|nr:response regulator [Paenibacillus hemerocallicola]TNJ55216.1 response regulator [Paenibacillus hemerocallicola]
MWNVLLVEDESFVRRSLKQLIRWEDMGFTIAGEAGDGQEALEMMRTRQPDLVIADIIMPVMDGIELMKRARAEGMESSFVVLTCMNEFEYARQALELGASGYLLKLSMNVKSLEEALSKAKKELTRNMQARSQVVSPPFQRLYRDTWQSLFGGAAEGGEADIDAFAGIDNRYESVWIGSFLHGAERFSLNDVQRFIPTTPGSGTVMHSYTHFGQTSVFVWNPAAIGPRQKPDESLPWPAAFSRIADRRDMRSAWGRVLRALDTAWYDGRTGIIPIDTFEPGAVEPDSFTWRTEREWIHSFEQRRLDEFRERLQDGWNAVERRRLPMAAVKETAIRIDRILSRIAGLNGTAEEELAACTGHRQLVRLLLSNAERYAERWASHAHPITGHPEIDKALGHIHRHSHEDVTLKAVAALVAMDEAYFSGLFKKKTGVTLIHYVQQVRVNRAKGLLEQTELAVGEVGERVGFPNTNYFIKIFKRWTGQTPSEYRSAVR